MTEETQNPTPETTEVVAEATEKRANKAMKDLAVGQELQGKVKSITPYGAFISIGVGRDGLVHISELSNDRVEKVEDVVTVGQEVTVKVLEVDQSKNRISLTMRTAERPARTERRRRPEVNTAAINALKAGDSVEGVVKSTTAIGAFVDIGVGKDGLVHISELADTRVAKVEDAVKIGESYTFKIIEIDPAQGRISLSLRRAVVDPKLASLSQGQILAGTVSGHSPFGVFVNIGVGRDGLVHTSEIPGGKKPEVGTELQVRVLNIDSDNNRISLSAYLEERPASERPDRAARQQRDDRPAGERRPKSDNRKPETYTSASTSDAAFEGDATLADLAARFGAETREKSSRNGGARGGNALPSDVIKRTLNVE
ncbi:MAG: hypothetical protein RLZZ297_1228 [Chloroflexota bacterium]|jgi:ribosomal protein S1